MPLFPKMIRVEVRDTILAQCAVSEILALGSQLYFPLQAIAWQHLSASSQHSSCIWKGKARNFNYKDGNADLVAIAWQYDEPKEDLVHLTGYLSFDQNRVRLKYFRKFNLK